MRRGRYRLTSLPTCQAPHRTPSTARSSIGLSIRSTRASPPAPFTPPSYERLQSVADHGARTAIFHVASAVANATVHPSLAAELVHLRGLCVYKPDGGHRPLGLPEAETRFFLGCVAAQERPAWAAFYTSPLPADTALERVLSRARAVSQERGQWQEPSALSRYRKRQVTGPHPTRGQAGHSTTETPKRAGRKTHETNETGRDPNRRQTTPARETPAPSLTVRSH